jgi:hypothetical protein
MLHHGAEELWRQRWHGGNDDDDETRRSFDGCFALTFDTTTGPVGRRWPVGVTALLSLNGKYARRTHSYYTQLSPKREIIFRTAMACPGTSRWCFYKRRSLAAKSQELRKASEEAPYRHKQLSKVVFVLNKDLFV